MRFNNREGSDKEFFFSFSQNYKSNGMRKRIVSKKSCKWLKAFRVLKKEGKLKNSVIEFGKSRLKSIKEISPVFLDT